MARRVIWSRVAANDLQSIAEYIERDSRRYAAAVTDKILNLAPNPQAIVTGNDSGVTARLKQLRRWPQISAVKTGSLFSIPGDLLARGTPLILKGGSSFVRISKLCGSLKRSGTIDILKITVCEFPRPHTLFQDGSVC